MMMNKIQVQKKGRYVELQREGHSPVRYDLADGQLQRLKEYKTKDDVWEDVEHQYSFFKDARIYNLEFEDDKFRVLLNVARQANPECKSISTYFSRLHEVMILESYIQAGIEKDNLPYNVRKKYRWYERNTYELEITELPFNYYDKWMRDAIVEYDVNMSVDYHKYYDSKKNVIQSIMDRLHNSDKLDEEVVKGVIDDLLNRRMSHRFWELVNDHNYDPVTLIEFIHGYLIPFEGFDNSQFGVREVCSLLADYYDMANTIGRNVDKYPKYLKSVHDMIQSNYNSHKRHYDKQKFRKVAEQYEHLQDKHNGFVFKIPEGPKDIISEGTDLGHCVSSYVDRILRGSTFILFLRREKMPDNSLVTVEVRGGAVVQARGARNRSLTQEEQEALVKLASKKELEVHI